MRAKTLLIVAVAAMTLMAGWSAYAQKAKPASATWEYKRVQILADDAALRELGAQGWELVAIDNGEAALSVYVFKRAR